MQIREAHQNQFLLSFFNQTPSLYNKILEQEKKNCIIFFPFQHWQPQDTQPCPHCCYSPGLVLPRAWHPLEAAPWPPHAAPWAWSTQAITVMR